MNRSSLDSPSPSANRYPRRHGTCRWSTSSLLRTASSTELVVAFLKAYSKHHAGSSDRAAVLWCLTVCGFNACAKPGVVERGIRRGQVVLGGLIQVAIHRPRARRAGLRRFRCQRHRAFANSRTRLITGAWSTRC